MLIGRLIIPLYNLTNIGFSIGGVIAQPAVDLSAVVAMFHPEYGSCLTRDGKQKNATCYLAPS
jgi:hypothetical protein